MNKVRIFSEKKILSVLAILSGLAVLPNTSAVISSPNKAGSTYILLAT